MFHFKFFASKEVFTPPSTEGNRERGERRQTDFRAVKLRHFLNIFLSSLPEVEETLS